MSEDDVITLELTVQEARALQTVLMYGVSWASLNGALMEEVYCALSHEAQVWDDAELLIDKNSCWERMVHLK